MERQKYLILTYAYPPLSAPRSVQISHFLCELSKQADIKVLFHPVDEGSRDTSIPAPAIPSVPVEPSFITKLVSDLPGQRIKSSLMIDNMQLWHYDLFAAAKTELARHEYSHIITFGQPMSVHIAGRKLKQTFPHVKWLAHFSDPWASNPFRKSNWFLELVNKHYEKQVIMSADHVFLTSTVTTEQYKKSYPNEAEKLSFLPHSFRPDLFPQTTNNRSREKKVIRYFGNFYGARQPDHFLRDIAKLPNAVLNNINVEFYCASTESLERKIEKSSLEKHVKVLPRVSYIESLKLMSESDFLLLIDAPITPNPFFPSKLVDYIGAKRPIIAYTPIGESQRILDSSQIPSLIIHYSDTQQRQKLKNFILSTSEASMVSLGQQYTAQNNIEHFNKLVAGLGDSIP